MAYDLHPLLLGYNPLTWGGKIMRVPISYETIIDAGLKYDFFPDHECHSSVPDYSGSIMTFYTQKQLRVLREYADYCRTALDEIREDLNRCEIDSGDSALLYETAKKLGHFCLNADSWGFNSLYDIGLDLQMILLESGEHVRDESFWGSVNDCLAMLSVLVEKYEADIDWWYVKHVRASIKPMRGPNRVSGSRNADPVSNHILPESE
jgi:hypothetical protein